MKLGARYRLLLPLIVALGLSFGSGGAPLPAYAANQVNLELPLVIAPVTNGCNGDTFTVSGSFHLVINETSDGNGGLHLDSLDNTSNLKSDATAVPSGSSYVVSQTDSFVLNISSGGTTDEKVTDHLNIISQGPAPNSLMP